MTKPICFIAARGGSKGIPRKNIKLLAGKPLIGYTIESSINSKIFSHVVVSTEDKEIARISQKFGAEVPFLRPKRLATDSAGMADVILHGLKKLHGMGYDFGDLHRNVPVKELAKGYVDDLRDNHGINFTQGFLIALTNNRSDQFTNFGIRGKPGKESIDTEYNDARHSTKKKNFGNRASTRRWEMGRRDRAVGLRPRCRESRSSPLPGGA